MFLERDRLRRFVRSEPVDLEVLRRHLRRDEVVVEFVLSEPDSFVLAITREGVEAHTLRGAKMMDDLVAQFLSQVKAKKEPSQNLSNALYSSLILPIPEIQPKARVVIVPDGSLHSLPFDSLRERQGGYLGDSHVITYAPSVTVLDLLRTTPPEREATMSLLAVGDPARVGSDDSVSQTRGTGTTHGTPTRGLFDISGADMKPLPSVADEVQSIARIAGQGSVVLLGEKATEAAFKAQPLDRYRILHLALHGIADTKLPDRSALILRNDPVGKEDGLLQTREISALRLNAELVTLSACDTGDRKTSRARGDGQPRAGLSVRRFAQRRRGFMGG